MARQCYVIVVTCIDIKDGHVDNIIFTGKEKAKKYYDEQKRLAIETYGEFDIEEINSWEECKEIYFRIGDKYEQFMRKENIH